MSNAATGLDIEDHGVVLLRTGKAACMVETGYIYPAAGGVFDMHFSIRTDRHYFVARDTDHLQIIDEARRSETRAMPTTNIGLYSVFVRDVLARVDQGRVPVANLDDMAAAMRLTAAAYALSPLPPVEPGG